MTACIVPPNPGNLSTRGRRVALRAQRTGALPMIDRGQEYAKMLRGEHAPRIC